MDSTLWFPLIFFPTAIVAGWIWQYSKGQGTRVGQEPTVGSWQFMAEELGLRFRQGQGTASVAGELEGAQVSAEAAWHRITTNRRRTMFTSREDEGTWSVTTRLRAQLPPGLPVGLQLREQTALAALAESLRSDGEIVLGDAEFDRAFLVQGMDPEAVARALTPKARVGLLVLAGKGILTMDEHELNLVVPDLPTTDRLGLLLGAMAGVARALA